MQDKKNQNQKQKQISVLNLKLNEMQKIKFIKKHSNVINQHHHYQDRIQEITINIINFQDVKHDDQFMQNESK